MQRPNRQFLRLSTILFIALAMVPRLSAQPAVAVVTNAASSTLPGPRLRSSTIFGRRLPFVDGLPAVEIPAKPSAVSALLVIDLFAQKTATMPRNCATELASRFTRVLRRVR